MLFICRTDLISGADTNVNSLPTAGPGEFARSVLRYDVCSVMTYVLGTGFVVLMQVANSKRILHNIL